MKKILLLSLTIISINFAATANNIKISNVGITGQNTIDHYSFVNFDLSWENSWRLGVGPANWDAAWVFIKFRVNNSDWFHARLNYVNGTSDGHTAPGGAIINTAPVDGSTTNGVGCFIYRSADGSGNVNYQNVQLRWNYGAQGVNDNALVDVQVFGIEMVYVPQGAHFLGGGPGDEAAKFFSYPTTTNAYAIGSENAITVGTATGNLYYGTASESPGDRLGPIPAAFPKGYNAFYCQKYETSQEQWVSFFNTLTTAQKTNRDVTDAAHKNSDAEVNRNTISWPGSGSATTTTPDRPVNYVSLEDSKAYLDWAGLRPMTELEYEKACLGPVGNGGNYYAWGSSNIHGSPYNITADGTPSEGISNPGVGTGNAQFSLTNFFSLGPLRCGIFAASADNKNREETGGSYYGIMEMSGNLYERVVHVGSPDNRTFTGLHGNGSLTTNGDANVSAWPTSEGFRGASYANSSSNLRVCDRTAAGPLSSQTNSRLGATRGTRTAN